MEKDLEQRVIAIEKRNAMVEFDKEWETSRTRKASVMIITYVIALIIMYYLEVQNLFLSAIVPVVGYLLSTLSLRIIKRFWGNIKS